MTAFSLRAHLRRCHYPAMLLLGALPPALLLVCHFAASCLPAVYALLAACAALSCLCIAVPGRLRAPVSLLAAALLFALGALLLPLRAQPALAVMPASAVCLLLASLPLAGRAVAAVAPAFYIAGIAAHLFVHVVIHFSRGALRIRYDALQYPLLLAFAAYLLLLLLALNSISLDNATMARCRLPASMRRINRLLTVSFLALSALIASLPAVMRLILMGVRAAQAFIRLAGAFVTWLLGDAPSGMGGGGAAGPMDIPAAEAAPREPSLFTVLLERLVTLLAAAVLVIGVALLLRLLLRGLLRLSRRLLDRLRAYGRMVSEDYEDEITDTREDGSASYGTRIRRRFVSAPMPADPAARVRWRYARLLRRKTGWADSSTARENLPQDAAAIYERARYSELPVSEEDADLFDSGLRRL